MQALIAIAILAFLLITQTGAVIAQIKGDLKFSERVDYIISIEDSTGKSVKSWKGKATDPQAKTWTTDLTTPTDVYTINITMDDGVNPPVSNTTYKITVIERVVQPSISIGSASVNASETATVQVSLSNANSVAGLSMNLKYDSSIVWVENVAVSSSRSENATIVSLIDNINGVTSIVLIDVDTINATKSKPIIDVTFKGKSIGTSDLNLTNVEITYYPDFNVSEVTNVHNGTITVLAPPKPSISVNTDKAIYGPMDTMKVSVNISNPSASNVIYELYIGAPQFSYWKSFERKTLSSGEYSFTYSLKLGNFSSSFSGIWFGHLLNSTSGEVLAQDDALWIYNQIGVKVSKFSFFCVLHLALMQF